VFHYICFRWKLDKLEREERKLDKEDEAKIAAAKMFGATL
jgi:hypothetical protein